MQIFIFVLEKQPHFYKQILTLVLPSAHGGTKWDLGLIDVLVTSSGSYLHWCSSSVADSYIWSRCFLNHQLSVWLGFPHAFIPNTKKESGCTIVSSIYTILEEVHHKRQFRMGNGAACVTRTTYSTVPSNSVPHASSDFRASFGVSSSTRKHRSSTCPATNHSNSRVRKHVTNSSTTLETWQDGLAMMQSTYLCRISTLEKITSRYLSIWIATQGSVTKVKGMVENRNSCCANMSIVH